jgi:hypothetical protein
MSFCPWVLNLGVPRFLKLGIPFFWKPITLCANFWLKWGLKQNYSPHQKFSNDKKHATCTLVNWGDFWLLVVGTQIGSLTPDLCFGHNLCFKYPNGSCKHILDIYVVRNFQRYKELFNEMSFDPCNQPPKDSKIHWESNSQSGSPLGSVGVHSLTLSYTPRSMKCDS